MKLSKFFSLGLYQLFRYNLLVFNFQMC